jgi:hypothetical protein
MRRTPAASAAATSLESGRNCLTRSGRAMRPSRSLQPGSSRGTLSTGNNDLQLPDCHSARKGEALRVETVDTDRIRIGAFIDWQTARSSDTLLALPRSCQDATGDKGQPRPTFAFSARHGAIESTRATQVVRRRPMHATWGNATQRCRLATQSQKSHLQGCQ